MNPGDVVTFGLTASRSHRLAYVKAGRAHMACGRTFPALNVVVTRSRYKVPCLRCAEAMEAMGR